MILGAIGHTLGGLRQVSVASLYAQHLQKTPYEFREERIRVAASSEAKNQGTIRRRGQLASGLSLGIAAQVVCLAIWIVVDVLPAGLI